jgi:hypothetical protein
MLRFLVTASLLCAASSVRANDSVAELGTNGLILSRTDVVSMESEDLFISADRVEVDYVFRNGSDKDVETIVAFPMPDLAGNPFSAPAVPDDSGDNFLDFAVTVDGKPVAPALEQRAFAVGLDVTAELQARNVPLYPFGDGVLAALAALPQDVADRWQERGMLVVDEYDDGSGWKRVRSPYWQLKSTYWWRSVFPAGGTVHVNHRYKPSVGGSVGVGFVEEGKLKGDSYEQYKLKYCFDRSFETAVLKSAKGAPGGYPPLSESRISYILTTGGNWATGTIRKFKLTVDKGNARNLVSFCGRNVVKTGPTTFEMTARNFYPEKDLDILILVPPSEEPQAPDAQRP